METDADFDQICRLVRTVSLRAIPSWLALFLRAQEQADFLDANAAEATARP
jgi:hypothetical protein